MGWGWLDEDGRAVDLLRRAADVSWEVATGCMASEHTAEYLAALALVEGKAEALDAAGTIEAMKLLGDIIRAEEARWAALEALGVDVYDAVAVRRATR